MPFRSPRSVDGGEPRVYWDFACSYGTQCQACGPRAANDVADELDELMHPSGPLYSDCATAPAHECCRTRHSFAISRRSFLRRDATGCSAKCATLLRDGEDSA